MAKLVRFSIAIIFLLFFYSCKQHATVVPKTQSASFADFVSQFDTLSFPLILSNPSFMKANVYQFQTLKKIPSKYLSEHMRMTDTMIPNPVYYFGQLPMLDSTYYLINYYEERSIKNPSMWWTLMKFDYFGTLLSETNISYCLKDSNDIEERFCKVNENYQCYFVEVKGKWNEKDRDVTDTTITSRVINLKDHTPR